jgi:ribosomal protein L21E
VRTIQNVLGRLRLLVAEIERDCNDRRFQPGDRVEVVMSPNVAVDHSFIGKTGTVIGGDGDLVAVFVDGMGNHPIYFDGNALAKAVA